MMLIPGPVEVPESVLKASAYVVNHRSPEFRSLVEKSERLVNKFADATATVMTTGSGTTAVESMIYSLTSPGDSVIAATFGEFGNRLIQSLKRRGLKVAEISKTPDDVLTVDDVDTAISRNGEAKAVFLVHNETGNGTSIHNLKEIASAIKNRGLRVYVDSVSGFGSIPIMVNKWGIDAMATCSQKGLASVPGLGLVSLGMELAENLKVPGDVPQYLDLDISMNFLRKKETPFTPSTGSFSALAKALEILDREGLERRWKRHSTNADLLRTRLSETGSSVMGIPENYSDTVIAFKPILPVAEVVERLSRDNIIVSRGMGKLSDQIVRVGNVGMVTGSQIIHFLNAYRRICGMDSIEEVRLDPVQEISREMLS